MEKQPEMTALIDIDGTVGNFNKAIMRDLEAMRSPAEEPLTSIENAPPWMEARMSHIKRTPGFWENLEKIEEGFAVLDILRHNEFDLHVLTKGPTKTTSAWTEKVNWCAKNIPDALITITQDKGAVYGKILFDDWPPYIRRWLEWRPRGLVLMLDHEWNRDFNHSNVVRVPRMDAPEYDDGMDLVRDAVKRAAKREPGRTGFPVPTRP